MEIKMRERIMGKKKKIGRKSKVGLIVKDEIRKRIEKLKKKSKEKEIDDILRIKKMEMNGGKMIFKRNNDILGIENECKKIKVIGIEIEKSEKKKEEIGKIEMKVIGNIKERRELRIEEK